MKQTVCKQSMLARIAGFPVIKTLKQLDFAKGVKRSQICRSAAGLRRHYYSISRIAAE